MPASGSGRRRLRAVRFWEGSRGSGLETVAGGGAEPRLYGARGHPVRGRTSKT